MNKTEKEIKTEEKFQRKLQEIDFIDQSEFNQVPVQKTKETEKLYQEYLKKQNISALRVSKQPAKKKVYTLADMDEIPEEDKPFMILDKDTGEYIDMRDDDELQKSTILDTDTMQQGEGDDDDMIWKDFWDKLNKFQNDLIDYAEEGEDKKLRKLFKLTEQQLIPLDINFRGFDDYTALHYAASEGNLNCLQILMDKNANLDVKTIFKRTPLHLAAIRGYTDVVEALVKRGADLNCQDSHFTTPIHYACESCYLDVIDILLQYKADTSLKTFQGLSVLELAQNNPRIWPIFQKYGFQKLQNQYNHDRMKYIGKMLNSTKALSRSNSQISSQFENGIDNVELTQVGLNDFNVYKVLGKGAFGKVYLVRRKTGPDQKYYAMKLLDKKKIKQHNLARYAKVEKNIMSIMHNPFIVKLNYAFQTKDGLFLVMQLCTGGDLSEKLDEKDKFDEDTARIYLAEVLLALEALHKNNIIFRDLKPANILIDSDGHALLADFGLANHRTDKEEFENNPRKSFLGTPAYLAPEMIKKAGHNRTIDWYLLGVLLYEFLTGITPYYANTKEELFNNILKGPLKMPNKGISDVAKDLIVRLLNRNPRKRIGYERDAEEIKEHPFFASIDWEKLYKKQYNMEKPEQKNMPTKPIDVNFGNDLEQSVILEMDEWSFVDDKSAKKK